MYSGRRVLHTRWVTTSTFGAEVEVEAADKSTFIHKNLHNKIERLGVDNPVITRECGGERTKGLRVASTRHDFASPSARSPTRISHRRLRQVPALARIDHLASDAGGQIQYPGRLRGRRGW